MIEAKELRRHLGILLKRSGFKPLGIGWHKVKDNHIVIVNLKKSNFGDLYYLQLKLFIKGITDPNPEGVVSAYVENTDKKLATLDLGACFVGFGDDPSVLDIEKQPAPKEALAWLDYMVEKHIARTSEELLTPEGLFQVFQRQEIFIPDYPLNELKSMWRKLNLI